MAPCDDVIVIGGGAAGLICAGVAASRGRRVILLERMHRPALKLGITGKGRCNLTNNCTRDEFLAGVRTNPRFIYSALSAFSPQDAMEFFESRGLPLKTERGGRVFPVSDRAADVVRALVGFAKSSGVRMVEERARELILDGDKVLGVRCHSGSERLAESVVIATGGLSYPATGSDGDGYTMAEQAGHRLVPTRASLVGIITGEKWVSHAMGLSLRNITLTLSRGGKAVFGEMGELLFTHFGVSGPLALSASAHITGQPGEYTLGIDLKPALSTGQLDERILRDFGERTNRDFINAMDKLLPRGLIHPMVTLSGINPAAKVHQITRGERIRLGELIKNLPLSVKGLRPVEEAVVTAGGVCVKAIHPGRMESKLVGGLFFAGEVLDLDAYTGGFNLQLAFSTGYLAGQHV